MLTLRLAFRNLFRNTRRTVLTMLMIGFSVSALILVDALTIGMLNTMTETFTKTLNGEAQVQREGYSESYDVDLYVTGLNRITAVLSEDPMIAASAPRVITGAMVASTYNVTSGMVHGVQPSEERTVSKLADAVVEGRYLSGQPLEILIGSGMKDVLEVDIGDRIVITAAEADTGELTQALFRVSGIFKFGVRGMDDSFVFINFGDAEAMLGLSDAAHQIVVQFVEPAVAIPPLDLSTNLTGFDGIDIYSWMTLNREIASMLEMSGIGTLIIGSILFLLVSFGVVNSMFMSVYERIHEIGVIKAVGTRPGVIIRIVLVEAMLLAAMASTLGALLAFTVGVMTADSGIPIGEYELSGVALTDAIKPVLKTSQFISYPFYTILLTMLAALYPAIYASRIPPSDALRKSL